MNIPKRCDVVVVGGGPAGSTAATALSQKGYDVVVFEKEKHPRFIVGESLVPHFWRYAELSGVADKIEAEGFIRKSGGTVVWNGKIRQAAFKDFGYERTGLHVERDRFDHILLEHANGAGAMVVEETLVGNVALNGGEAPTVTYRRNGDKTPGQIGCRFVIDASGQKTLLDRQLGIHEPDEAFRFVCIWGYFENAKYVAADGHAYPFESLRSVPPTTFVTSVGTDWGWAWHIPLRASTSVGFVLPLAEFKAAKTQEGDLEAYFLNLCETTPELNRLLADAKYREGDFHVIRDFSYRPDRLVGPGYFLVGDAAAFVDPVYALGVTIAMYSASSAAQMIDHCFRNSEKSDHYQALYQQVFRGRYLAARALHLPGVEEDLTRGELIRQQVKFYSASEQELMAVAAFLANRYSNFEAMSGIEADGAVAPEKYRELEAISY